MFHCVIRMNVLRIVTMSVYCFEKPEDPNCICTDVSQQKIKATKTELDEFCESKNTPNRYKTGDNYVCCGMINTRESTLGFANAEFCESKEWKSNVRSNALLKFWTDVQTEWKGRTNGTNHA